MSVSEHSETRDHSGQGSSEARVLLIGKDDRDEGGLEAALDSRDCLFDRASDDAEALRLLRSNPYGVVITDRGTTIEEDLALIDEIRDVRPDVRVIILAPCGTPEEILEALRQRVFLCRCAPYEAKEIAGYAVSALEAPDAPEGIEVLSADRDWISIRMKCQMVNADRLIAFLRQLQMKMMDRPREELMTAFREILNNAIEHGAQNDPTKSVRVDAVRTARAMVFHIIDPGEGFRRDAINHAAVANTPDQPTRHIEIRERAGMRPGGYGILVASGIVDELIYNEKGNEVLLIKHVSD